MVYLNDAAFATRRQLDDDLSEVQSSVAKGNEELLELASPCLKLTLLGHKVEDYLRGGGTGSIGGVSRPKRYDIAKGTEARYADGGVAGRALSDLYVEGEGREQGGRRCYALDVGVDSQLCFDASSLKERK